MTDLVPKFKENLYDEKVPLPYESFSSLHPHHPGAITDHVTDFTKGIIDQTDLFIGRWNGHNTVRNPGT